MKRAEVLNYWITVVEELYKLNNFNGMCVVIASLSSSSVFRLKETWKKIDKKKLLNYSDTCKIISTDSASKVYREHLLKCNPPLVPHLGNVNIISQEIILKKYYFTFYQDYTYKI